MAASKLLIQAGTSLENLLKLGFIQPESAANPSAVKSAATKYKKLLETSPAFKRKEARRLNSSGPVVDIQDIGEGKIVKPEDFMGQVIVPVAGDRTVTGHTLLELGGHKFKNPVAVKGGPRFPIEHQDKGIAWASMPSAAKSKQANVDYAARMTDSDEIVGMYTAMGDDANNFATPIADVMIQEIQSNKIDPKIIKEFDAEMRKKYPKWVGLKSPDARDQLMGLGDFPKDGAGAIRTMFVPIASKAKYRNAGFPSRNEIRDVVVEPELLGASRGDSGFSMFDLKPEVGLLDFTENPSYTKGIQGSYRGGLLNSVPAEVAFPKVFDELSQKVNKRGVPFSRDEILGSLVMDPKLYQKVDQKWVDGVYRHLEELGVKPEHLKATAKVAIAGGALAAGEANAGMFGSLVKLGYPESTARKIADGVLPMDTESRIKRATEQGYDLKVFHTGSGDILNLDPTEARSFDTAGTGFWSSDSPELSSSYARIGSEDSPTMYPMLLKTDGMYSADAGGSLWSRMGDAVYRDADGNVLDVPFVHTATTDNFANDARKRGASGLIIDNVVDTGPDYKSMRAAIEGQGKNYMDFLADYQKKGVRNVSVQDPSAARSLLSAAFDPDQTGSSNILASRALPTTGSGLLAMYALSPEDARAAEIAATDTRDVGSIEATKSDTASDLATLMRSYNRKVYNDPLLGMVSPKLPANLFDRMAYNEDIEASDILKGYAGLLGFDFD